MNPAVRTGRLSNGLTYYVLEHHKQQHRAALWLAVNAGSVLEDDDQRGLAHLVEHMAFNGTKRFPRLAIIDLLERSGIVTGADLNAATSFDQTVYRLTVPTDQPTIAQNALSFLRDVAGDVSFDPAAIDKERSIVLEEWRLHRGVSTRLAEKELPILLRGSRYADRLPIGLPEVIKTADAATLRRFYRDWYRPDLMAVIAVGDFDGQNMQAEIAARFSDLTEPVQPRPRLVVSVPREIEPLPLIQSDPEQQRTVVTLYERVEHRRRWTKSDYRSELVERLYSWLLSDRLYQLRDEPNSPWISARSGRETIVRGLDVFTTSVTCPDGHFDDALGLLFREGRRAARYGFSETELDRARKSVSSRRERSLLENESEALAPLAGEITRNFFEQEEMPGPDVELAWTRQLSPGVTLAEVNALARLHADPTGKGLLVKVPASQPQPTVTEIQALAQAAQQAPLAAWVDTSPTGPLVATPPTPGRVVSTKHDASADATVWTLANGVRVVLKPTTFRREDVMLVGWEHGGKSMVSDADVQSARFAEQILGTSGAGKFSPRDLNRLLAGKAVAVSLGLGELDQWVAANARPEDLEAMLQLLYLKLTKPPRNEFAFEIWRAKAREAARHRNESPELRFVDEITRTSNSDAPRARAITVPLIDSVSFDRAYALWKERFRDFGGYTFVFVGNFEADKLRPWVEIYLGSLPSTPTHEHWRDAHLTYPSRVVERTVIFGSEPKSLVWFGFGSELPWSRDAARDQRILEAVLRIRLSEVLRDDLGETYDVAVRAEVARYPKQQQRFDISFGCAPESVDRLQLALFAELAAIAHNGIGEGYLAKVKEQLRRRREVDVQDNSWWVARLREAYYSDEDFADVTNVDALLARATSANVQASAQRTFDPERYMRVALRPSSSDPAAARVVPSIEQSPPETDPSLDE